MEIDPKDLRIDSCEDPDTTRSSWSKALYPPKGVRITHIPTGISVCSCSERRDHLNRVKAMRELTDKLLGNSPRFNNIQEYLEQKHALEEQINYIRKELDVIEEQAEKIPIPENLREVTPEDIIVGNVIWYPEWEDDEDAVACWCIVVEVHYPNDDWKAYTANDGSRYGLYGAYVEAHST